MLTAHAFNARVSSEMCYFYVLSDKTHAKYKQ